MTSPLWTRLGPLVEQLKAVARRGRSAGDRVVLAALDRAFGGRDATAVDVYFAYRLLLGRAPDEGGFEHHVRRAEGLRLEPADVAREFLSSEEFGARQAQPAHAPGAEALVRLDGFELFVDGDDEGIGGQLRRRGEYEPAVTRALRALLPAGATFLDVGANVGFFTLLAARHVGPAGRVLAVEAMPSNARLLRRNVEHNRAENVEVHAVAAGDAPRTVTMTQPDRKNSGSPALGSGEGAVEVPMVRLDDVVAGRPVALVKLDVEGAEGLALAGLAETLERVRPALLLEYTPSRLPVVSRVDGPALLRSLAARGYGVQRVERFDGTFRAEPLEAVLEAAAADPRGHVDLVLVAER